MEPGALQCPCCGERVDLFGAHWRDEIALRDPQTGAANYALLRELSGHAFALARRYGRYVCALDVEIVGLEKARGTSAALGAKLARAAHTRLRRSTRESDLIARIGPDRFLVLLSDLWEPESSARVAHRILHAFERQVRVGLRRYSLGVRMGAALFPEDGGDVETLARCATQALARAGHPFGLEYFDRAIGPSTLRALRLESDLTRGLATSEFALEYQPIIAAANGAVVGAEALARWNHSSEGKLQAEHFIDLAERSGRIRSIDCWALDNAAAQARRWLNMGFRGWVSVNISARSLFDHRIVDHLARAMEENQLPERSLVLEVTETSALVKPKQSARMLAELNALGAYVALDDFGAGHSSFRFMQDAPIDILKVDRSFVLGLSADRTPHARLLEGLIMVAHHLGKPVVAEGVEEPSHRQWLADAECDLLQGYLLGRPVPPDIFTDHFLARGVAAAPSA